MAAKACGRQVAPKAARAAFDTAQRVRASAHDGAVRGVGTKDGGDVDQVAQLVSPYCTEGHGGAERGTAQAAVERVGHLLDRAVQPVVGDEVAVAVRPRLREPAEGAEKLIVAAPERDVSREAAGLRV